MALPLDCDTVTPKVEKNSIRNEVKRVVKEINSIHSQSDEVYDGIKLAIDQIKNGSIIEISKLIYFRSMLNSRIESQKNFTPFSSLVAITCMTTAILLAWIVNSVTVNNILIYLGIPRFVFLFLIVVGLFGGFSLAFILVNGYYKALRKMVLAKEIIDLAVAEISKQ
ncbi:hypothetical protein LJR153_006272 [Paenibacillus sp. LjRoot153]|uniref:hypothetical protein n=1 Tax=Paenibacillus sp. LjRoot153 TaxID=3342270 RepID=UPI003ECCCEF1